MDLYPTTETWTGLPGEIAPADGNYTPQMITPIPSAAGGDDSSRLVAPPSLAAPDYPSSQNSRLEAGATSAQPLDLGPNNELLEDLKPKLVHALRELVRQYREEGVVARRNEIRRIRQARLFWQGLQYAWWNPNDMNWHLPYENRSSDDRELEDMPRYQFVTNFYQGFGLSFVAVLSQDVPTELTDQQLASTNALNQQLLGQQQQVGNNLTSQYQSILNNPGLSPAAKAAVTAQSQGSIASAFDSLQQSAANRVARTGNSAGFSALTDDLARQKGIAEGNQAQQNQLAFYNTATQQQMSALQGLSGLYGVDSNLLGRTLGIPSQLLSVRANASKPTGFFSSLGNSTGGGLGSTLAALPGMFL
ncbi:MAG: hypothetical protein ABSH13_22210 [Candidatus Acidiferrum sp.]|jgi:hypothetical protein